MILKNTFTVYWNTFQRLRPEEFRPKLTNLNILIIGKSVFVSVFVFVFVQWAFTVNLRPKKTPQAEISGVISGRNVLRSEASGKCATIFFAPPLQIKLGGPIAVNCSGILLPPCMYVTRRKQDCPTLFAGQMSAIQRLKFSFEIRQTKQSIMYLCLTFTFTSLGSIVYDGVRHCGIVESARAWDGTGYKFEFWKCRIHIPCSKSLRLLGVHQGFSGYIWLDTQIIVLKK